MRVSRYAVLFIYSKIFVNFVAERKIIKIVVVFDPGHKWRQTCVNLKPN